MFFYTPTQNALIRDFCFFWLFSLYSNLSLCTEEMSDCLQIPWPNPLVEDFFVDIHSAYFKECPTEEFSDPTPATVFALVITPICLIPVMVSLVVLKTKNGDGSSWWSGIYFLLSLPELLVQLWISATHNSPAEEETKHKFMFFLKTISHSILYHIYCI